MTQATAETIGNAENRDSAGRRVSTWHKRKESDRYKYLAYTMGFAGLTYAAMLLYYFGVLPLWGLIAANVLFYIRAYLRMHDLCHAFNTRKWLVRYVPTSLFANPVWGGTTAFITTHVEHHKYLGTDRDPWLWYYAGHPVQAFFFNMIEPEWNFYNYVKRHGISRKFAANVAFDVLFQAAHVLVFQGAYLVHLVVQRACHGVGVFLFNFYPHRGWWSADAPIGNFNREQEVKPYQWLIRPFFGKALTEAAYYHNRHHIIGQIHVPSHLYVRCSDEGRPTQYTKQWPLPAVQHLEPGARHAVG